MRHRASGVCGAALAAVFAILPARAATPEEGQAVYNENCASCHGEGLRNPGSSFDLKQLKPSEKDRFIRSVLAGKNQMPPWKGVLSGADLDALWLYIQENAEN
jgi:cytochrome c oxidase subunit 2